MRREIKHTQIRFRREINACDDHQSFGFRWGRITGKGEDFDPTQKQGFASDGLTESFGIVC